MLFKNVNKCLDKSPNLIYDEACLDVINVLNNTVKIFGQYSECHKCEYQTLTEIPPSDNTSILVYTRSALDLYYTVENGSAAKCRVGQLFSEHYRYGWNITQDCRTIYLKEPADNAYLPILGAFIVLFCFGTIWYMVKCIYKNSNILRRLWAFNSEFETDLGSSSGTTPLVIERTPTVRKHSNRLKSMDVFRGLCIIVMIFVNYGGGQYWFFKHSIWNGLTVADLVFPWFAWLMGMSLTVSLQNRLRQLIPKRQLIFDVLRRSFLLILFGVIINSNHNLSTIGSLRFPGVLQRLGITYLIIGLMEIGLSRRLAWENPGYFQDITTSWIQWLVIISLVIIHICITFFVDVPGCGRGYLGPGGLDFGGKYYNCTGGVAGYIDRSIFGKHMYKKPPCKKVYETTVYYDPEGLLGTLTCLLVVYLGVQAGKTLLTYSNLKAKVIRWTTWGVVLALIGGSLCEFKKDDGLIPINKQLWSLSYVLIVSGMAFVIQCFLHVCVDVLKKWGGRPFFYPGMNSIFLYVGHELFKNTFPFAWNPVIESHAVYLFMNLWGTALWVSVSIYLYKHHIFFKL